MGTFVGTLWVFALCLVSVIGQDGPFSGHTVVRVTPKTTHQLQQVTKLLENTKSIDVWKYPSMVNNSVDIRLSPLVKDEVIGALTRMGLMVNTMIQDVQSIIDEQAAAIRHRLANKRGPQFEYFHYHTLEEIHAWIDNITTVFKDKASVINITTSTEGRLLKGIKISTKPQNKENKARPAFYFEGGIHADEWISPATVIYMAGKMLDLYGLDPELTATVDKFDWYILPVTNPDGYVYTWQGNDTRMWRKTRSRHVGEECVGVDPNRNWDIEWCTVGTSKDPCDNKYCGPHAFSEPEVRGVAEFLQGLDNVKAFIDIHSYGQMWMTPYSFKADHPPDFKIQDDGSILAVEALTRMYGTKYKHGTLASVVTVSSGSSADWTYVKAGIKFSYGVELRDTGEYGMLLPEEQIVPSGLETLAGLKALADYIAAN